MKVKRACRVVGLYFVALTSFGCTSTRTYDVRNPGDIIDLMEAKDVRVLLSNGAEKILSNIHVEGDSLFSRRKEYSEIGLQHVYVVYPDTIPVAHVVSITRRHTNAPATVAVSVVAAAVVIPLGWFGICWATDCLND